MLRSVCLTIIASVITTQGARKLVDERKRIDRQLEAAKKKADHNEELRRQHELHVQAEYKEQCKRDEEEAEAKVRHKHELLKRRYQREQEEQERLRRKEKETEEEVTPAWHALLQLTPQRGLVNRSLLGLKPYYNVCGVT